MAYLNNNQIKTGCWLIFQNLRAIRTSVLVDVGVGLHVTVQHTLVDATVVTVCAAEWFRT